MSDLIYIILTALLSSWLTYFFGIRKLRTETELELKAERYQELIRYLRGFVGIKVSVEAKEAFFQNLKNLVVLFRRSL